MRWRAAPGRRGCAIRAGGYAARSRGTGHFGPHPLADGQRLHPPPAFGQRVHQGQTPPVDGTGVRTPDHRHVVRPVHHEHPHHPRPHPPHADADRRRSGVTVGVRHQLGDDNDRPAVVDEPPPGQGGRHQPTRLPSGFRQGRQRPRVDPTADGARGARRRRAVPHQSGGLAGRLRGPADRANLPSFSAPPTRRTPKALSVCLAGVAGDTPPIVFGTCGIAAPGGDRSPGRRPMVPGQVKKGGGTADETVQAVGRTALATRRGSRGTERLLLRRNQEGRHLPVAEVPASARSTPRRSTGPRRLPPVRGRPREHDRRVMWRHASSINAAELP